MILDNVLICRTENICKGFARYFSSIYNVFKFKNLDIHNFSFFSGVDINTIKISADKIFKAFLNFNDNKVAGLDDLPSLFLRRCCLLIFCKAYLQCLLIVVFFQKHGNMHMLLSFSNQGLSI